MICIFAFDSLTYGDLLNTRYKLDIRFSELSHSIYVQQQVDIVNMSRQNLDTVYFHLSPNAFSSTRSRFYQQSEDLLNEPLKFTIQSVSSNDTDCQFIDDKKLSMAVLLPDTICPGDSIQLQIAYTVTIPQGMPSQCPSYNGANFRLFRFYPVVERFTENGWTPEAYQTVLPASSPLANYSLSIQLPAKYKVVCSLPPAATSPAADSEIVHFFKSRQLKELAIIFSATSQINRTDFHEVAIQYLSPLLATRVYQKYSKTEVIQYLTNQIIEEYASLLTDYPYPYLAVAVTNIKHGFTAPNMLFLSPQEFTSLTQLDYNSVYQYAQSVAEQYFYYYLYMDPDKPDWLNDGLVAFAANQFMRHRFARIQKKYKIKELPESSYSKLALRLAALATAQEKVSRPLYRSTRKNEAPFLFNQIQNYKSLKILEIFNYYVGDSIFQSAVNQFILQYRHKPVHSALFIKLLEAKSGKDLTNIHKIWVESEKLSDIKIKKVKTRYQKKQQFYTTTVIARGAPISALPIEISAVDLRADTLVTFTSINPNGIDTVYFHSKSPLRKISLDPNRRIWEFNRLNNHHPYQVLFKFLIGIPRIDAYQIFYYPTFDFNKRDLSRIGIKLRGRYWINMRPLFPAQSLDEWTLGINYGLRSKTVGYDVSYHTSLLHLFFQPRIHFQSRDYFGLNETSASTDFYFGEIRYPLLHKIQGYKKINLGVRYQHVRTLEFLNQNNWQRGKLLEPYVEFTNFHNWGHYRHIINLKLMNGAPILDTDYRFIKIILDTQVKFRPAENLWLYERIFFGVSRGSIPLQRYFYFFGKNTLENMSFENFRLVKGAGDMRGYGAASPKGRNILTNNAEVRWTFAGIEPAVFDLIAFFDSGLISNSLPKMNVHQLKHDAGVGTEFNTLETITVGLHIPFWVSHPVDDKPQFAPRWVVSVDLSL